MNKTYKALSTFKIKRDDRSYLSLVKNQVVELSLTEYNNVSAEGIFSLTTGWQNAILTNLVDEAQTSSDASTVTLDFNVYSVEGVWLATDTGHTGTNYFTGGSWSGKVLTLGTALPGATTAVIVNYKAMGNTITTSGGAIAYTKTFTGMTASTKQKMLKVDFVVDGTIPAGAVLSLDAYNASGVVVETKTELMPTGTDTTVTGYLSGSFLNRATSYKVYGTVPQASGSSYNVQIVITEVEIDNTQYARVTNAGMVSGVNVLEIDLMDEDGVNIDTKDIIKVAIASDPIGTFAAATVLNGVAVGTDGELIETADDQYMELMSESDGHIDLQLTPTNAGTATYSELTISTGVPTDTETVTIGTEVYEFHATESAVTAGNIWVDTSGAATVTDAAVALKGAINNNTAYDITADNTAGVVEITANKSFVAYNSLATTETGANMAWADTTFGGGTGTSVTGVDPTSSYYLLIETYGGMKFTSQELPYTM